MGDPRGFLKLGALKLPERPVAERIGDYRETSVLLPARELRDQASRCMDCGVPFCHAGCPLGNLIPEWNEHVHRGRFDSAAEALAETNNFPEITGRVCPAPCEASCVLNLQQASVSIKAVERTIAEHSFAKGLVPRLALARSGKRVAIVGSGPAGLAAAQQLARLGHDVTVFERDDRIGGLLRYGIPDFKLEKSILDRRLEQMVAEGVAFKTGVHVGVDVTADALRRDYDAIVLAGGARRARDLEVPGRELDGVHFAMDFLTQQNHRVARDVVPDAGAILATGKHVVVIGGGDTGADCVGTSNRQGARSVSQLELMPRPGAERGPSNPWPEWPLILRTSTSHEEGCVREFALSTKRLLGHRGRVERLEAVRVKLENGRPVEIPGSELTIPADLVLLAMGFSGVERTGLVEQLGVELTPRQSVTTSATGATQVPGVFAAGDMSRGQSLVVWAIADGRRVAAGVHDYLQAADSRVVMRSA